MPQDFRKFARMYRAVTRQIEVTVEAEFPAGTFVGRKTPIFLVLHHRHQSLQIQFRVRRHHRETYARPFAAHHQRLEHTFQIQANLARHRLRASSLPRRTSYSRNSYGIFNSSSARAAFVFICEYGGRSHSMLLREGLRG